MRVQLLKSSLLFVALLAAPAGWAGSVFLNGVNIDGVAGQKFEKATVRIDDKGNIHIDAPGYAVRQVEGAPAAKTGAAAAAAAAGAEAAHAAPKLTKRYFLVTEQNAPGMTEFDVDVFINSKWIRKLRSDEDQIVTEVTRYLQPGKNTVLFTAKKNSGETRRSYSPEHYFRVLVGEGNVGGDNVMIDDPVVNFRRNASEAQDVSQEFAFETR